MSLDDAQPMMRLARPALAGDGRFLLGQGAVLTDSYLERLRSFDIRRVWIHDDRLSDVMEMEFYSARTRGQVSLRLTEIIAELAGDRTAVKKVLGGGALDSLVTEALDNRRELIPAPEASPMESPLVAHSVRVCLTATAIGSVIQFGRDAAVNLAAGALLHDLGQALSKAADGGGSPDALDLIAPDHTSLGFEAVVRARRLSATVAIVCLQHHERQDGSGYPKSLKGDRIHPFAALCAVADRYDNLVSGKAPMLPHQAMQRLLDEAGTLLDAGMVGKFRARVAPYPVGTPLLLNTGQQTVVARVSPPALDRPVVRLMEDGVPPQDIDLVEHPSLTIEAIGWHGSISDALSLIPS